jgi:hypothetical protein
MAGTARIGTARAALEEGAAGALDDGVAAPSEPPTLDPTLPDEAAADPVAPAPPASADGESIFTTATTPIDAPSRATASTANSGPREAMGMDVEVTNGAAVNPAAGSGVWRAGAPGYGVPGSGVPGYGVPCIGVLGYGVPCIGVLGYGVPCIGVLGYGVPGAGDPA